MLLLLLALTVLNLTLLLVIAWILYQVSGWTHQHQTILLAIQRVLNAFDRPDSLASSGVEVGHAWIPTDREAQALEAKWRAESEQRGGVVSSKRTSTRRMG